MYTLSSSVVVAMYGVVAMVTSNAVMTPIAPIQVGFGNILRPIKVVLYQARKVGL